MKKIISTLLLCLFLADATTAHTQTVGKDIKRGLKKAGNKTAEVASKGKSSVVDKKHKTKTGPNGEVIYIDKNRKYYFVDKKGRKHYVSENALKDKKK